MNAPIEIDCGEVELCEFNFEFLHEVYEFNGTGNAFLKLLPAPHIELRFVLDDVSGALALQFALNKEKNFLKVNGLPQKGFFNFNGNDAETAKASVIFQSWSEPFSIHNPNGNRFEEIEFPLFNLAKLRGTRNSTEERDRTTVVIDHVDMLYEDTVAEIRSYFDTEDRLKKIRSTGMHQQTHGFRVTSDSGFDAESGKAYLDKLALFLNFAFGRFVRPSGALGRSSGGDVVWSYLSAPDRIAKTTTGWFDQQHGNQLSECFPLFMRKLDSDISHNCVMEVVHLYLSANDGSRGIDGGIVLAQTAIERVAYEVFVNDKTMLTREGFGRLNADDRMRLLLRQMNVSLELIHYDGDLAAYGRAENWKDLADGIARARNSIVHPQVKRREEYEKHKYAVWTHSLWLLELAILFTIGYTGEYANRLTQSVVGVIEEVPWTTQE